MKCLKEPLSLGSYLLLVDYTGRLFREGKATISRELAGIFDRIGSSAEAGGRDWRSSGRVDFWVASSRPAASVCERSRYAWACATLPTWPALWRDSQVS